MYLHQASVGAPAAVFVQKGLSPRGPRTPARPRGTPRAGRTTGAPPRGPRTRKRAALSARPRSARAPQHPPWGGSFPGGACAGTPRRFQPCRESNALDCNQHGHHILTPEKALLGSGINASTRQSHRQGSSLIRRRALPGETSWDPTRSQEGRRLMSATEPGRFFFGTVTSQSRLCTTIREDWLTVGWIHVESAQKTSISSRGRRWADFRF